MKGLELSRLYFEAYGSEILREFDPEGNKISAGLAGYGSECLGYDDELSTDHDFEPRFYLWLSEEDEAEIGFKLMRAYNKLPRDFMGYKVKDRSLFGGDRGGVSIVKDFFRTFTGLDRLPSSALEWLYIPDYALLAATGGEVFFNGSKEFSSFREGLKSGMPEDVRRKKLAARLAVMAQSGQYNYARALERSDYGAAGLAAAEFVTKGLEALFILNKQYAPYYKWLFRAAKELPLLSDLTSDFEYILNAPHDNDKTNRIESVAHSIAEELRKNWNSPIADDYLEGHAVAIYRQIRDKDLISLHLMEG